MNMYDHHACVYSGVDVLVLPEDVRRPGADVEHVITERLSIEEARTLRHVAERRPQEREVYEIVVVTRTLPVDSQNTLLKLFEDPPPATRFHLVVPSLSSLIPTLRSRVQVVGNSRGEGDEESEVWSEFIRSGYKDRLALIEKAHKSKRTDWFNDIFTNLEVHVHTELSNMSKTNRDCLFQVVTLYKAPGASKKMLAESAALSLP